MQICTLSLLKTYCLMEGSSFTIKIESQRSLYKGSGAFSVIVARFQDQLGESVLRFSTIIACQNTVS